MPRRDEALADWRAVSLAADFTEGIIG